MPVRRSAPRQLSLPGAGREETSRARAPRILAGTCGFAYRQWKGSFYPSDLPDAQRLGVYAARLPTVEIDGTFYRPPDPDTLAEWYRAVPAGFRFALKAPREITHERRLRGIAEPVHALYLAAAELEEKLGPILFQLPPTLARDLPLLRELLDLVPRGGRTAVEFRHPSWRDDAVLAALRDAGAALCAVDGPRIETPLVATGRFGYVRLARPGYDRGALARWVERIRAQPWGEAFVFFKNPYDVTSPALAEAMLRLARR